LKEILKMTPIVNMEHDGMSTLFVAGFLFRDTKRQVALIEKLRPDWQKGKYNGIGGKVEKGETPLQAMQREFKEETGADISLWRPFCNLRSLSAKDAWQVIMFMSETPAEIRTMEDEQVDWYNVSEISYLDVIPNLRWLIPMAIAETQATATVIEG
jgi:8-oxo-dGTP diphosphatase